MRARLNFWSLLFFAATLLAPGALSAQAPAEAGASADSPPATVQGQRNWLLARLIVDRNLTGQQISAAEQKLANMSADQLDVLSRVYQHKRGEQAAAAGAQLQIARENLDQLKNTRDALANEVQSWRDYRQAQYVSFGPRAVGYSFGGVGYGGYGFGGVGYGGVGYAAAGYPYAPFGAGLGVYPNVAPVPNIAAPFFAGYPGAVYGGYPMIGGVVTGFGVGVY